MKITEIAPGAVANSIASHVTERLETKKSCTIYQNEISQAWPLKLRAKEAEMLNEAIQALAKENGWSATISDPGIRVTFKKLAS